MKADTPKFRIGQTVFHVADEDAGKVVAIVYYADHIAYMVGWDRHCTDEYSGGELSDAPCWGDDGDDDDRPKATVDPRKPVPVHPGRN